MKPAAAVAAQVIGARTVPVLGPFVERDVMPNARAFSVSKQSEFLVFNIESDEIAFLRNTPCRATPPAGASEGMGTSRPTHRGLTASCAMPATYTSWYTS